MRRLGLLLSVAVALVPACTSPPSPAVFGRATASSTTTPPVAGPVAGPGAGAITLAVTSFDVRAAAPPAAGEVAAVQSAVLATLDAYLEAAVAGPLRTGGPAADLAPLFTAASGAQVSSGPDRGAIIDEGLPPLAGLVAQSATVGLTGLAGADGKLAVVDAALDVRLVGTVGATPVTVARRGELVLLPDGGTWKIDAYDLKVSRDSGGRATTSAARR